MPFFDIKCDVVDGSVCSNRSAKVRFRASETSSCIRKDGWEVSSEPNRIRARFVPQTSQPGLPDPTVTIINPEWEIEFRPGPELEECVRRQTKPADRIGIEGAKVVEGPEDSSGDTALRFSIRTSTLPGLQQNSFRSVFRLVNSVVKPESRVLERVVRDGIPIWFLTIDLQDILETKWVFGLECLELTLNHWEIRCLEAEAQLERLNRRQMYCASITQYKYGGAWYVLVRDNESVVCVPELSLGGAGVSAADADEGPDQKLMLLAEQAVLKISKTVGVQLQPTCIIITRTKTAIPQLAMKDLATVFDIHLISGGSNQYFQRLTRYASEGSRFVTSTEEVFVPVMIYTTWPEPSASPPELKLYSAVFTATPAPRPVS